MKAGAPAVRGSVSDWTLTHERRRTDFDRSFGGI